MSEGRERATASLAAGIFSTFSTVCDNYGLRTGRRGQAARRRGATGHSEWGHAAPGEEPDTSVPGKPVQKLSVQIEGVKTTVVNTKNVQIIQIRQERGIEMYKNGGNEQENNKMAEVNPNASFIMINENATRNY